MCIKNMKLSLFEFGYLVVIFSNIYRLTADSSIKGYLLLSVAGYIIIVANVLRYGYTTRQIALLFGVFSVLLLSFLISKDELLLPVFTIGLSYKSIKLKRLIRLDLAVRSFMVVAIMVLCKIGMLNNITFSVNSIEKSSYGFSHPNHLGGMVLIIVIYFFYLKHKRFRIIDYILVALLFYISNNVAHSRTSSYLIASIVLFEIVDSIVSKVTKRKKYKERLISIIKYGVFAIPLSSIWLAYNYTPTNLVMAGINRALTGRLYLGYYSAHNNPITLFGNYIEYLGGYDSNVALELSNAIDNSYLYILLHLGLIVFIIFLISLFILLSFYQKCDRTAFLCLIILMVGGFIESTMFDLTHNIFIVGFVPAFIFMKQQHKTKRKRKKETIDNPFSAVKRYYLQ